MVDKEGASCWLKGGAGYIPQFTYDNTEWHYYEGYRTGGILRTRRSVFTDRNTALSHCVRHPLCQSVHFVGGKYYLRTGEKVSDALGEQTWLLGKTKLDLSDRTIVHHNLHWQTLKYVK